MKRKSSPKPLSSAPRILLLTDCVAASRLTRALAEAGISVLLLSQEPSDAFREVLEAERPDLLLISLAHSPYSSAELRAHFESNPAMLTLAHVSSNCWSSNSGSQPEMMSERARLSDINTVSRFLQMARQETVPAVDFADLGAWLSMGPVGSTVCSIEHRMRPFGAAADRQTLVRALLRCSRSSTDRVGAYCILSPIREDIFSTLDKITHNMDSVGLVIAFGTVVLCRVPAARPMRLIVGILTPPAFPRDPTQRKITHPSGQEQRTLEGASP